MKQKKKRKKPNEILETEVLRLLYERGYDVTLEAQVGYSHRADLLAQRREAGRMQVIAIDVVTKLTFANIHEVVDRIEVALQEAKPKLDAYWIVVSAEFSNIISARGLDRRIRIVEIEDLREELGRRPKSKAITARTKIGRSVGANQKEILLAVAGLILQIDANIESLRDQRPNSPEAIAEQNAHISEYERMRAELERLQVMVEAFKKGQEKEAKVVESVNTFSKGVQAWWDSKHAEIVTRTFDMGLFAAAVGICSMAGAGGKMAVAVSAALVGGKPVAQALKGLLPKRFLTD
jgi:hypothetical protein